MSVEKTLVLAKAYPVVSSKYEELVCVADKTSRPQIWGVVVNDTSS